MLLARHDAGDERRRAGTMGADGARLVMERIFLAKNREENAAGQCLDSWRWRRPRRLPFRLTSAAPGPRQCRGIRFEPKRRRGSPHHSVGSIANHDATASTAAQLPGRSRVGRALWSIVWLLLYRPSPVPFHGWRRFLLRCSVRAWAPTRTPIPRSASGHHGTWRWGNRAASGIGSTAIAWIEWSSGRCVTVSQYSFLCTAEVIITGGATCR